MKSFVYLFVIASLCTLPALADDAGASKTGVLKKFEDTNVITDTKLKADAGSFTRLSLKANLAYYGPPIADLDAKDQPNPDNVVSANKTAIAGSLGARFRFNPTTTTSFGSGLKETYPFREDQKLNLTNPYVSFDKSFRLGGLQVVASPGVMLITDEALKRVGEAWGLAAKINGAYPLSGSNFVLGADTSAAFYFFSRDYLVGQTPSKGRRSGGDGLVQRISLSVNPNIKYNITSKLSAISSIGFTFYNPRSRDDLLKYSTRLLYGRLGMGYAITNDVYLNPYLQLYPTRFSWRTVTGNISTVFSVL